MTILVLVDLGDLALQVRAQEEVEVAALAAGDGDGVRKLGNVVKSKGQIVSHRDFLSTGQIRY